MDLSLHGTHPRPSPSVIGSRELLVESSTVTSWAKLHHRVKHDESLALGGIQMKRHEELIGWDKRCSSNHDGRLNFVSMLN